MAPPSRPHPALLALLALAAILLAWLGLRPPTPPGPEVSHGTPAPTPLDDRPSDRPGPSDPITPGGSAPAATPPAEGPGSATARQAPAPDDPAAPDPPSPPADAPPVEALPPLTDDPDAWGSVWPLTPDGIQQAVGERLGDLQDCYDTARALQPDLSTRMVLELSVDDAPDGVARPASVGLTGAADAPFLEGCVATVFEELQFEPGGGATVIRYPVVFSETPAAPVPDDAADAP